MCSHNRSPKAATHPRWLLTTHNPGAKVPYTLEKFLTLQRMHIQIQASVGHLGHNRPFDVLNIKAAINVYFRSVQRTALSVYAGLDSELVDAIRFVQQHAMRLSLVDGLVRPNDPVAKWLSRFWIQSFKTLALTKPKTGLLTWEAEGVEGGPNHSRKLHVPSERSGLTIGRGYDLSMRNHADVVKDLCAAVVPSETATLLAYAVGLRGSQARHFVIKNDLLDWEISVQAQVKLFELILPMYENKAKRLYVNSTNQLSGSAIPWDSLKPAIQDVLIDLAYRGDYVESNRIAIFNALHNNDPKGILTFFSDRSQWSKVPLDRFNRRALFLAQRTM